MSALLNDAELVERIFALPRRQLPPVEPLIDELTAKLKKPKGGIRLDDLEAIRDKSRSDNLVLPHKPE